MRKNGTADNCLYGKRPRHNVPQIATHDKFAEYSIMDSIAGHSAAAFIKGMQCYEDTKKRTEKQIDLVVMSSTMKIHTVGTVDTVYCELQC